MSVAKRFINENLAQHWRVDETKESFKRLLFHLESRSNFRTYFERAIDEINFSDKKYKDGIVVADIGAGVCWTSALIALRDDVKHVFAVDPSTERLKHAKFIVDHFNVPKEKISLLSGSFSSFNFTDKIDLFLLCGAIHHCSDEDIPALFLNLRKLLKKDGRILIANEHYVGFIWTVKRAVSYFRHFKDRDKLGFDLNSLRAPHPVNGEHWRTRKELENIFFKEGFKYSFYLHNGDLCKDKSNFYHRLDWHYYYAVLERLK